MDLFNESLVMKNILDEGDFKTFGDLSSFILENQNVLNESFNIRKKYEPLIKKFNKKQRDCEVELAKRNIDVNLIKDIATRNANAMSDKIKGMSFNKTNIIKASEYVADGLMRTRKTIIDTISTNVSDILDKDNETGSYIFILFTIIIINTYVDVLLKLIFGPVMGESLTAVFVAPITEEIGKLTATKVNGKHGQWYNIIFNAYELSYYVSNMSKAGGKIMLAIGLRIPAVIMHTVNQLIIDYGYKRDIAKGKDKDVAGGTAVMITMIIHAIFNFMGTRYDVLIPVKGSDSNKIIIKKNPKLF